MILEINNLKEIIVRVNGGSGIVLKLESDSKCYVLTAYHNIESSVENKEEIALFDYKNKPYSIMGEAYCDIENDFALLEIEYIDTNIPIVKYDKNILPDDTITFIGYPDKAELERKRLNGAVIEWNDKTAINVLEEIKGSFVVKEYTDEVILGFSGSGVFKKYGQEISLIGILKSLPEKDFDYKEISCVPIEKILGFIQNNQLGNLSTFEKIHELMYEKQQHTERVLFNIHTEIKFNTQIIELDRTKEIKKLKNEISKNQISKNKVLILTGVGGVGKTAIIKKLYEEKKEEIPFYLFEANEFDLSLIDDLFGNYNFQNFIDIHKQYKQKIIVIDSAEKLLDIDTFKPFKEFLSTLIQSKWKVIFTIRDSSLKDLKSRFFDDSEVKTPIILLKNFTINELSVLANKYNFTLSKDVKLNELITNPFYLNKYLKFYDIEEGLIYQEFKQKLWDKTIKSKDEKCFLDLAYKRVKKGLFHIYIDCKSNSLESLVEDKVLGFEREGYFITHDIYEEWALEKIIDRKFYNRKNNKNFFKKIDSSLPIRRSFRNWVSEKLLFNSDSRESFIEDILENNKIEQFWKDEVFISILLSDYSDTFFKNFEQELFENDALILERISFLLKRTCKEVDNSIFEPYELQIDTLEAFSMFNKPKGLGWESFINIIYKNKDELGLKYIEFILPILKEWQTKRQKGKITRKTALLALNYYELINQEKNTYRYNDYINEICNIVISGAREIEEELKLIFDEIIKNQWKDNQDNYYRLSMLILSTSNGLPRAFYIINNMPQYVLKLADLFWTKQPIKEENDNWYNSNDRGEVEDAYGIDTTLRYFPASAYQTPIYYMLRANFSDTIDFLLEFIHKSVEKYAQSDWEEKFSEFDFKKESIKEIVLEIDDKIIVKQYHSQALWDIYRGTSSPVSPNLLQSIHMALEKYLLEIAKDMEHELLESLLASILVKSKSSSLSAVITSVILANSSNTINIALALFRTKEFIYSDLIRNTNDMTVYSQYTIGYGLNQSSKIYTDERIQTCEDKHRKNHLEQLFLQYQYYQLFDNKKVDKNIIQKIMEDLWSILDNYYTQLPIEIEQSESDKTWSMFLARMDMRKMDTNVTETENGFELTLDLKLPPKLQEFSENSQEKSQNTFKYASLRLWASNKINNNQDYKKYQKFEKNPLLALEQVEEVRGIPHDERDFIFIDDTFVEVSVILLRDYNEKLSDENKILCKDIILYFSRLPFQKNYRYQSGDGKDLAIKFLPILLDNFIEEETNIKIILLLALFKGHDSAINSISTYYDEKVIKSFMLGYLLLKPKYDSLYWEIRQENYGVEENKVREKFFEKYKESISLFFNNELEIEKVDFNVNPIMLSMILNFIKFPKVKPNDIFKEVSKELLLKVFQPKKREEKPLDGLTEKEKIREIFSRGREEFEEINLTIKQRLFKNLSYLIFKLDVNEIKEYLKPLLNNFRAREDIAYLLLEFIKTQDRLNEYDKFWSIWYLFENKIIEICKDGENSYTDTIIQTYLLASSPYGKIWNSEAKTWHTLKEKDKIFFKRISKKIGGHCPSTLYSISKLLTSIGSSYLNDGIGWISSVIKNDNKILEKELEVNTIYYLEQLSKKYILQNSEAIKKNKSKKEEILEILNFLVEKGSVVGNMLRERVL